jgi:hypothetical protein
MYSRANAPVTIHIAIDTHAKTFAIAQLYIHVTKYAKSYLKLNWKLYWNYTYTYKYVPITGIFIADMYVTRIYVHLLYIVHMYVCTRAQADPNATNNSVIIDTDEWML